MRRMMNLHLEHPFAGHRMMRMSFLKGEGPFIGRKHVATLMQSAVMLCTAIYLLRNLPIERLNHVWAMDITYVTPNQRSERCN
jgi:putative transposase